MEAEAAAAAGVGVGVGAVAEAASLVGGDGARADAEMPPTEIESPTELPPTVALPQPLLVRFASAATPAANGETIGRRALTFVRELTTEGYLGRGAFG